MVCAFVLETLQQGLDCSHFPRVESYGLLQLLVRSLLNACQCRTRGSFLGFHDVLDARLEGLSGSCSTVVHLG